MKTTRQTIARVLTVIALAFTVSVSANAQLGGLVDKAKKAGKGVVEGKSATTIAQESAQDQMLQQEIEKERKKELTARKKAREADEKKAQAEAGQTGVLPEANPSNGEFDFYLDTGRRLGLYNKKDKSFKMFGKKDGKWIISYVLTFKDDGKVMNTDGSVAGIINKDGSMYSGRTRNISIDEKGFVRWKGEKVGYVNNISEVYVGTYYFAYSDEVVDPKISAFIVFCAALGEQDVEKLMYSSNGEKASPGQLNASLHNAALSTVKKQVPGALDAVIVSDEWTVMHDGLGNITHRMAYGYYMLPEGDKKRAYHYCWRQNYLGGGKYDSLQASGPGDQEPFLVK
ncbi:MAG: cell envelope integrity protein TolA [Muribaculaceae bacterium]|nr:cell envelope integrity protein TolA [Muribaculaceae bacterium]